MLRATESHKSEMAYLPDWTKAVREFAKVLRGYQTSDTITSGDTNQTEGENDNDAQWLHLRQHAEVEHDNDSNKRLEDQDELALVR